MKLMNNFLLSLTLFPIVHLIVYSWSIVLLPDLIPTCSYLRFTEPLQLQSEKSQLVVARFARRYLAHDKPTLMAFRELHWSEVTLLIRTRMTFIHSDYFYSASSDPLLLRGASDTARILCRNVTPKRHRQRWVKDLPTVPTWRLERESNLRPFERKASTLPMRHPRPITLFYGGIECRTAGLRRLFWA